MKAPLAITRADKNGRETQLHGTSMFPVGCYYDDLEIAPTPWHWHDEFDAVTVVQGSAIVSVANISFRVNAGDGFFINAEQLHKVDPAGNSGCILHSISFHPRLVGGSFESTYWAKVVKPLQDNRTLTGFHLKPSVAWQKEAIRMINAAFYAYVDEPPAFEIEIRYHLSKLLFLLSLNAASTAGSFSERELRDNERMKLMIQYIHAHLSEELTVNKIASSALLSKSECLRCFKNTLHTTPMRYVKQHRIEIASTMLLNTQ